MTTCTRTSNITVHVRLHVGPLQLQETHHPYFQKMHHYRKIPPTSIIVIFNEVATVLT